MKNQNGSVYIEDGCNFKGYIESVPRLHGSMRFTYRPLGQLERVATQKKMEIVTPSQGEKIAAETVRRRMIDWDVTHNDQPVRFETAEILRLQPMLYQKLYLIIFGQLPSDLDPMESESDCNESAELQVQQIFDEASIVSVISGNSEGQSE